MVILRATRKLHALLPPSGSTGARSDTALGDWYVNRIVIDRRPILLLVSSTSLLPMLVPARDVRALPSRLADLVAARLGRHGVARGEITAEILAMSPVVIAATSDRSVIGIMVEFAKSLPYHLEIGGWDESTLASAEAWLSHTPCHAGRPNNAVIWPDLAAPALLKSKWGGG